MRLVLKRIVVNGLITALVLALLGFIYAELASIWLASSTPTRAGPVENAAAASDTEPVRDALRYRVPLLMAVCGFAFIAVCELLLYWWRGAPQPAAKKPASEPQPDAAELLLEQLMAEADAALAKKDSGVGMQDSGTASQNATGQKPTAPARPVDILNPES
jgi:hypothetical protein